MAAIVAVAALAGGWWVSSQTEDYTEDYGAILTLCQESALDTWKHEGIVFVENTDWKTGDDLDFEVGGTLTAIKLAGRPPVAYTYRCAGRGETIIAVEIE